ncbi:hypothetical protein J3Q64DRAFT_1768254, partial [Phycomyces blakesleeanus]
MSLVVLKVSLGEQTRRFSLAKDATWRDLCDLLEKIFNTPFSTNKCLFYQDNEGECISLSSDLELKHILDQQDDKCIRLCAKASDLIKCTTTSETTKKNKNTSATSNTLGSTISPSSSHDCQEEPRPTTVDKNDLINKSTPISIYTIPIIKTPQTSFAALFEHFGRLADQYRSVIDGNPYVTRNLGSMASEMLQDIQTADISKVESWLINFDPNKKDDTNSNLKIKSKKVNQNYPDSPSVGQNDHNTLKPRKQRLDEENDDDEDDDDEEEEEIELPRTPQEYAADPFYGPLGSSVSSRGSAARLTSLYPSHYSGQLSIVSDDEIYQTPNEDWLSLEHPEPPNYTFNDPFSKPEGNDKDNNDDDKDKDRKKHNLPSRYPRQSQFQNAIDHPPSPPPPPCAPLQHLAPPPNSNLYHHHLYPQPPHWPSRHSHTSPEYTAVPSVPSYHHPHPHPHHHPHPHPHPHHSASLSHPPPPSPPPPPPPPPHPHSPPQYNQQYKDHYGVNHFYPHHNLHSLSPSPPQQQQQQQQQQTFSYLYSLPQAQFDRISPLHNQAPSLYQTLPPFDYGDAKRSLRRAMKEEKKALKDQGKLLKKEVRDIRRSIRQENKRNERGSQESESSYEHEAIFSPESPKLSTCFGGYNNCSSSGSGSGIDETIGMKKGKGL